MELRNSYTDNFKNLLKLSEGQFDYLKHISPLISKSDTNTGDFFKSLNLSARHSENIYRKQNNVIFFVCTSFIIVISSKFVKKYSSEKPLIFDFVPLVGCIDWLEGVGGGHMV